MKILILEDSTTRHRSFLRGLYKHNVQIVEESDKCIQHLKNDEWDMLFLDHDLGGEIMVDSGPGTGYEVACWLEENPDRKPRNIILHSLNDTGRKRMRQALPEAQEWPWAWRDLEDAR